MVNDFAEHTVVVRRLLTEAEQCERDKMYKAAAVEVVEAIDHLKLALAYLAKKIAN